MDGNGRRGLDIRWRSRGATVPSGAPAAAATGQAAPPTDSRTTWPTTSRATATLGDRPADADGGQAADDALATVLDATRALLWIETPDEAASLARSFVELLGGKVTPAGEARDALPVDVSFGAGDPVLPAAPPGSSARAVLTQHLGGFVRDTHRALELADRTSRLAEEASIDPLTGVCNRRMLGRTLARLREHDTVIVIDLDHFKTVNDTLGHDEGDRVLSVLGQVLNESVRASDRVGRYGGEEFVVVLSGGEADPFLRRFQSEWCESRPHAVTFSAGVAPAGPDPQTALKAADRAMYRAKLNGRDQWQWATEDEYAS